MQPREWLDGCEFPLVVHSQTTFCSLSLLQATQALRPVFG